MNYGKSIAALVATLLSAILASLAGDQMISSAEWVNVAIAGVGAAAVFAAPNVPGANYTKSILAVLAAILVVLNSSISDGVSNEEWLQMALAALGALGVYAAPYRPQLAATGRPVLRGPE